MKSDDDFSGLPLHFLMGDADILSKMAALPPLPIFSEEAVDFLSAVSRRILADDVLKKYPNAVTFAFWCRRASLRQLARRYEAEKGRLGRGVTFHIAPSNVALNFAYSLAASLLSGNASIVRLPTRDFPEVSLLARVMGDVLKESRAMKPYIALLRYGHEQEINDALSSICDTRVIWGGDETIRRIRTSPLPPRANEITFADRYSIAVIDAANYLAADDKERIAHDFFNDTYLTDQDACTAPRIVVWMGDEAGAARRIFWETLHGFIKGRYELPPIRAVDKLTSLYLLAAGEDAHYIPTPDNLITRVEVTSLAEHTPKYRPGGGFFIEYLAKELEEILPVMGIRCQTLSYLGISREAILDFLMRRRPRGVDRVVPMGKTMDFSLVWDGVDLIRAMSRIVGQGGRAGG